MGAEGFMANVQDEAARRAREEVAEVKVEQYAEAAVEAEEQEPEERGYLGFKDGKFV